MGRVGEEGSSAGAVMSAPAFRDRVGDVAEGGERTEMSESLKLLEFRQSVG